jgi:ligand-binding sensor domain-containing protein
MKTLKHNLSTASYYFYLITWLLLVLLSIAGQAADLTFMPATPIVEIDRTIALSVSGTEGMVKWIVGEGTIQGEGTHVTYVATSQAGLDVVAVLDSEGNTGLVKIVITPPNNFSLENAQWEIFTDRSIIRALSLSEDGQTLWVGTTGGLEKRDATTGDLQRVFLNTDGLPHNHITALLNDRQGELWIGTEKGLAYLNSKGELEVGNKEIPEWPRNYSITVLLSDEQGGLWIGTEKGLAHRNSQGQWRNYDTVNSKLPANPITALLNDGLGGLWIGSYYYLCLVDDNGDGRCDIEEANGGLAHLTSQGELIIYTMANSELPEMHIVNLLKDGQGGLWINGLAYLSSQGKWTVYPEENSEYVQILRHDKQGKPWVDDSGLIHLDSQNNSTVLTRENLGSLSTPFNVSISDGQGDLWMAKDEKYSKLLNDEAKVFHDDGQGGLWIGTQTGDLIHLSSQGKSTVYNSELPFHLIEALCSDGQGGVWIGNYNNDFNESGNDREGTIRLAHLSSQGQWTTYEKSLGLIGENSSPVIQTLLNDGQGGVWIITDDSYVETTEVININMLIHLNAQSQWKVYNELGDVFHLSFIDEKGNLWIGMTVEGISGREFIHVGKGLAHLNSQDQLKVYTKENSDLPDNYISQFLGDGQGGLWIVTREDYYNNSGTFSTGKGLAHLSGQGEWTVYTKESTALLSDNITSIRNDGQGGLWIEANNVRERAHLTFGRRTELCTQSQIDSATCQAIQQGQHAAIIVAAGGAQETNTLWESTEAITIRIYRTFDHRGFAKSNLYYLSPKTWTDFNGDGYNDHINRLREDRNLTLDDLQAAFTWAKGLGKLDQPLYFFFMDHGGEGKLQLSPNLNLTAEELKTLLDDYQTTTGNSMVAVIEACHSGSLIPILTAPNRAVIASAKASEKAYFYEKKGFSRFLADYLLKGANFFESFGLASRDQEKLRGKNKTLNSQTAGDTGITLQTPQLDDNQDGLFTTADGSWLKQVYINGNFETADATLTVDNQTPATTLTVGQTITLQAKATLTQGTVNRVWAVIRPPAIAQILDTSDTPILAFPRMNLGHSPENPEIWQATWNDAVYNGKYLITFYAEDDEKNIASSEQDTVLTVSGGSDPPDQAQVQIHLEKDRYQSGDTVKATVKEDLGYGYDLYIGVQFPDGHIETMKDLNQFAPLNPPAKWWSGRLRPQSVPMTILDKDLATGQYCLYGVLSPAGNDGFEAQEKGLWVLGSQCFEVF